jgi:hypothetical protein
MTDQALTALPREAEGRIAPSPALTGKFSEPVAEGLGRPFERGHGLRLAV